jgi:hypothetical protein
MLKVSECQLCGRYYRTGKLRQLVEKCDAVVEESAAGKRSKAVFKERRMLVCKECYKRIENGEGVAKVDRELRLFDEDGLPDGFLFDNEAKSKSDSIPKHGRVIVGSKEQAEAIESALKDGGKPVGKKRGRKPKSESGVATDQTDVENATLKASEAKEPVEQDPEHEALKDRVRQILAENNDILYSEISTRLGIDEGTIAGICDELDKEGGK